MHDDDWLRDNNERGEEPDRADNHGGFDHNEGQGNGYDLNELRRGNFDGSPSEPDDWKPDRYRDREYIIGQVHARLQRIHRLGGETVRCYHQGRWADCESLARTVLSCTITDLFDPLTCEEVADWETHERWHRGLMAHAWGYLGLARYKQNDPDGAVMALQYACLATPTDFRPWVRLAGVEARLWRVVSAWKHLRRAFGLAFQKVEQEKQPGRDGREGQGGGQRE
jgi:hypothetical protein